MVVGQACLSLSVCVCGGDGLGQRALWSPGSVTPSHTANTRQAGLVCPSWHMSSWPDGSLAGVGARGGGAGLCSGLPLWGAGAEDAMLEGGCKAAEGGRAEGDGGGGGSRPVFMALQGLPRWLVFGSKEELRRWGHMLSGSGGVCLSFLKVQKRWPLPRCPQTGAHSPGSNLSPAALCSLQAPCLAARGFTVPKLNVLVPLITARLRRCSHPSPPAARPASDSSCPYAAKAPRCLRGGDGCPLWSDGARRPAIPASPRLVWLCARNFPTSSRLTGARLLFSLCF